jgi:hypothetical protein
MSAYKDKLDEVPAHVRVVYMHERFPGLPEPRATAAPSVEAARRFVDDMVAAKARLPHLVMNDFQIQVSAGGPWVSVDALR